MKTPRPLTYSYTCGNGDKQKIEVATVFEDYWGEQFAEVGDPLSCRFDVRLFDGDCLFDGMNAKDQVGMCRRLAGWLLKYADWLERKISLQRKLNIRIEDSV